MSTIPTRRFSVALPAPLAGDLSAMATQSGVRPSEVLAEALRQFEPFKFFHQPRDLQKTEPRSVTIRV
jgi:hypothetical protein